MTQGFDVMPGENTWSQLYDYQGSDAMSGEIHGTIKALMSCQRKIHGLSYMTIKALIQCEGKMHAITWSQLYPVVLQHYPTKVFIITREN